MGYISGEGLQRPQGPLSATKVKSAYISYKGLQKLLVLLTAGPVLQEESAPERPVMIRAANKACPGRCRRVMLRWLSRVLYCPLSTRYLERLYNVHRLVYSVQCALLSV